MMELFTLFFTFFKIGLFTIGGGYAMIPLMQQEVMARGWMALPELIDFIAISESTPGPFAVNVATFVGYRTAGFFGSFCATLGIVLPSFLIILFIAKLFLGFQDNRFVKSALYGARPVVVGLIAAAVLSIAKSALLLDVSGSSLGEIVNIKGVIVFGLVLFVYVWRKLRPVQIILLSAVLGLLVFGGGTYLGF